MNRLASILPPAQVLVSVDATSKKRAFEEAGLLFENLHGLGRALITDSLFARERLGSTGLGHGVAIPHGRIKGLKAPMAAVFQLAQPIGFDAPDEQPVVLLIFLLVPEAATQKHLEILSEIAELLSDAGPARADQVEHRCRRAARPDRRLAVRPGGLKRIRMDSLAHEAHRHQRRRDVRGVPRLAPVGVAGRASAPRSASSIRASSAAPSRPPTWWATSTTSIRTASRSSARARSRT